ncbi:OsmC family protein [Pseudomonas sp. F1_0610]|uniref:OsmC family protein n=1 Tax=Pseudomonas sp. F1_0610 TaxID=3114284 RepID=UPI0039C20DFC
MKTVLVSGAMGSNMTISMQCGNHEIRMDQPKNAGGSDKGPTPPELLLASLAGCVGSIARIVAHQQKLNIKGMQFKAEGDFNPDKLLGKDTEDRAGFQQIRLEVSIDSDLNKEQQLAFLAEVERRCPIADNLLNLSTIDTQLV